MDGRSTGMIIVVLGAIAIIVGLIAMTGALSWVGRLPGDIRIASGNTRVYIPITTMILASVVLSLVSFIFRRFL